MRLLKVIIIFSLFVFVPFSFAQDGPPHSRFERGGYGESDFSRPKRSGKERGMRHKKQHGMNAGGRIGRLARFLGFMESYHKSVRDPYNAVGLVAFQIKESHKKAGDVKKAIPEFEELLTSTKDQEARNIFLFMIRQIHEEEKDDKGLKQINARILKENIAAIEKE